MTMNNISTSDGFSKFDFHRSHYEWHVKTKMLMFFLAKLAIFRIQQVFVIQVQVQYNSV